MWPFKPKAARPSRSVPTPPFIDSTAWAHIGGAATTITPRAAENLAAILGAVNAIACTIASLPAYVTTSDDSRSEVKDHPLHRLINFGVNDDEAWPDFIEGLLASCLLRGNALAQIEADDRGRLRALRTLPWPQVTPYVDQNGVLLFDFIPMVPPNQGQRQRYMRADCLFLKDRSDSGVLGVSRLTRAAGALNIALELQSASSIFLQNAARPGGALTADRHINDDAAARIAQDFQTAYGGSERGKIPVLSGGLKFEPFELMSANDVQIINHRNFSVSDVCRIYSVPPWLLADPIRATLASATAAMRSFTLTGLLPWVRKLEAAFAQSVLSSGYALHFDVDALVKADIAELYTSLLKGRQGGWLSPNDCRTETGFPTVPGGDSLDPPVSGGLPASDGTGDTPPPDDSAPVDDASKSAFADRVARLDNRRARHGND